MNDHADLIAEARRHATATVHPERVALIRRLADALEAAAQRSPLPADVDAAIQRLEADLDDASVFAGVPVAADLRTVLAAAQRPPLTDATRERFAAILWDHREYTYTEGVHPDGPWGGWGHVCSCGVMLGNPEVRMPARVPYIARVFLLHVAGAILAEYAPVASTRERLAEARWRATQRHYAEPLDWATATTDAALYPTSEWAWEVNAATVWADEVLASGAVEGRAEVRASELEAEADELESAAFEQTINRAIAKKLRARAASIREGRA